MTYKTKKNLREPKRTSPRSWQSALYIDPTSGRATILRELFNQLVAIHYYYQQRNERVIGVTINCPADDFFEASLTQEQKLYFTKLRVTKNDVYEYGREESL
jgi:hypothetical protein